MRDIGLTRVWAAAGLSEGEPAPLLVVHDGPEYVRQARLTTFLAAGVRAGRFPPLRAALLAAADRNDRYSANDDYADALATALPGIAPATRRIGLGASLGALALLHAQIRHPDALDALFLQSGSYFQPRLDAQESGFPHWGRITGFVARVLGADGATRPVPVAMTCGGNEENLGNNQDMAAALLGQGYPLTFLVRPGGHDYGTWRAAFEPPLTDLLAGS